MSRQPVSCAADTGCEMNTHEHARCEQTSHPAACRHPRWLRATSRAALSDWHLRSSRSGRLPAESAEPLVAREACAAVCCKSSQSAAHFGSSCRNSWACRLWETCLSWPPGPFIHSRKCHKHTSLFSDPAAEPCPPHPREEDGRARSRLAKSTLRKVNNKTHLSSLRISACLLLFHITAATQLISRA